MKTESGESEINFNELDSSSWDVEEKKGFELSHGCGVLFDLFHNCSCKLINFIYKLYVYFANIY